MMGFILPAIAGLACWPQLMRLLARHKNIQGVVGELVARGGSTVTGGEASVGIERRTPL